VRYRHMGCPSKNRVHERNGADRVEVLKYEKRLHKNYAALKISLLLSSKNNQ